MGVLAPLTFSIQSSGQAYAGATISITTALPAPIGLIPEGSVAWLPCVRVRVVWTLPLTPLQTRLRSQGRMWRHTRNFYRQQRLFAT